MAHDAAARRIFLISFAGSFFLFSCITALAVLWCNPRLEEPVQAPNSSVATGYLPSQEEALTLLLALEDESVPHTFLLLGFEPAAGRMPVLALPPSLALRESTLGDLWQQQGRQQAADALAGVLGAAVDRTGSLEDAGLKGVVDLLGPLSFQLPYQVTVTAYGDTAILRPGLQQVDGRRAVQLAGYQQYPGGESTRLEVISSLVAALADQKLEQVLREDAASRFSQLVDLLDTNLTASDFQYRLQAARFLAKLQVRPGRAVPFLGERQEDGRHATDPDTLALVQQLYHP